MTTNGMFIYQDGMYSITVFKHFIFKKQFSLIIEIIFLTPKMSLQNLKPKVVNSGRFASLVLL